MNYYIVTGAAGFIGSRLVRGLNRRGVSEIIAVDNLAHGDKFRNLADCEIADYVDQAQLGARLEALEGAVEAVFHQGACSDTLETDGRYMMENNYAYSRRLLDWCQDEELPLVYASSAAVYGRGPQYREERACERPLNLYGYSKFLFDQVVRSRLPQASAQIVGLRYFNVYGPNEWHKGRMASVALHAYQQLHGEGKVKLFAGADGYRDGEQRPVVPRTARRFRHLQLRHRTGTDFQPPRGRRHQRRARHAVDAARRRRQRPHRIRAVSSRARRQISELYRGRPFAPARGGLPRRVHERRAGRHGLRQGAPGQVKRTLEDFIGNTPLVRLQRLPGPEIARHKTVILAKLEGNNPAGSVKDRPAIAMIRHAEHSGRIKPGATLIEPTSGNTGIALAMAAATRGYRMVLIMPEHLSAERRQTMRAYGAEIVLTPQKGGMEAARDLADKMVREGAGTMLDQFANPANPQVHYDSTGPEIWRDTDARITHFVSSMGTTGTIMGCSRYFKEKNPKIEIIGCQPQEGSQIPGIRKWPEAYLPKIYDPKRVDRLEYVSQGEAEEMTRRLAREEGIFAGISSGGAMHVALRIARDLKNAVIVTIVCDRGDRYLTTGVFPD